MKRTLLALCIVVLVVSSLLAGPYFPEVRRQLPLQGLAQVDVDHDGTLDGPIGYCVSVEDAKGNVLGRVEVPYHMLDAQVRSKAGLQPLELKEFEASVSNAVALVAGPQRIAWIGDPVVKEATATWTCATTYRDRNGQVLGCNGACGDCTKVRVREKI